MKRSIPGLFFALLFTFSAADSAAENPEKLSFAQTLERALSQSLEFRSLKLVQNSALLSEKNAWWNLAPTVDLTASHSYLNYSGQDSRTTAAAYPWSTQAGLNISENLYDNGNSWRNAEIASLVSKIETLKSEKGRSKLLVDVAKAFYDYSQAVISKDLQQQQTDTLKMQYKSIESRYRQGLQSNRDYLRIQAQIQSSEISLLNQQLQLNSAITGLRSLIGEFGQPEFVAIDPTREKGFPVISIQGLDPQASFEFRIASLQNEAADLRYTSVSRSRLPTVSLKGSFDYVAPQYLGTGKTGTNTDPYWNLQALLVIEYRLWDWGSRERQVEIADNSKNIEYNSQAIIKLNTQKNIEEIKLRAQLLQDSFKANQQMLKASQSAYQNLNTAYLEGKVSYLELITSLSDLYSARQQDLNLRMNILKLKAELAYYQGNVDEVLKSY